MLSARWSPDRAEAAFVCDGDDICLVDATPGNFEFGERFAGHGAITGAGWSPDGMRLATTSDDNALRIWTRAQNGDVRTTLRAAGSNALKALAFDPKSGRLAAGDERGGILVWDADGANMRRIAPPERVAKAVSAVAWSAKGVLAAAYGGGGIGLFDATTGKTIRFETLSPDQVFNQVTFVGERAAAQLRSGRIAIVDADPQMPVAYLGPLDGAMELWGIAGHPDGSRLLASYTDGSIRIWNVANAAKADLLISAEQAGAGAEGASGLAISGDGRWIASTRNDRFVALDAIDGKEAARQLTVDVDATNAVAFNPDGTRLAALGADGRLYVWAVDGGKTERIVAVQAVPDRSDAGRTASLAQRATGLAWLDRTRLAISTVAGTIEEVVVDPDRWRARAAAAGLANGG